VHPNPSRWAERLWIAAIAAVGLAISVYLSAVQVGAIRVPWDPIFGPASSARVLHSGLTRVLPVPDAIIGAAAYTAEIVTGLVGGTERWRTHPGIVLVFGAIVAGLALVGAGLVIAQAFVLRAACTLCLASALCSFTAAAVVIASGEVRMAVRAVSSRRNGSALTWR
jgi:uncharacterized membrane protein